jgi:hypothetical protein
VCSDPANVIYGLTSSGNIRPVHVGTGAVDSAINPPTGLPYTPNSNAIGYNPINGNFYYFEDESVSPGTFVSFNPSTNQTTTLATMPYYAGVLSGCVNETGTGYYCLDAGYALFYYDIAANSWTMIDTVMVDQNDSNVTAQFQSMYGGDMAIDGAGNLWMVTASLTSYALYMAPGPLPTTNVPQLTVMQLIPQTTLYQDGGSIDGIAFDPAGNIYLSTNSNLYELMYGTTTITHIGGFTMDTTTEVMEDLTSCNFPGFGLLPLAYSNFTASLQPSQSVMLNWQYSQPAGGGFSIERSPDGQHWSDIGYEAATSTGSSMNYSWPDTHPLIGMNYYRLSLQSTENGSSYSPVKMIDIQAGVDITVAPNPVKDILSIQYDGIKGNATATLYDPSGRKVMENVLSAGSNNFSVAALSPGLYIISVQFADGGTYTQKVLKQ